MKQSESMETFKRMCHDAWYGDPRCPDCTFWARMFFAFALLAVIGLVDLGLAIYG